MSTAQDLPLLYGEALPGPTLRLVQPVPLDFEEAVRRVRPRLHRYAIRRLGDVHEAEELVQEALLRAYSHREKLLTEDDLAAWSTVVTGRLVIDRLRVRGRSLSVADVPESSRMSRDTADVVVARDEARMALDALDAMPTRQAALLWAREVEGQSYDELCERFAMTEPAVRSVLTRARKALRKEYASRGGTLPIGGLAVLAPWVAGLSWAGRLRRAAERVTAPAALSAVGITTLGGLVLSPFGVVPQPTLGGFRPDKAVVASVIDAERIPHATPPLVAAVTGGRHVAKPGSAGGHQTLVKQARRLLGTCVNSTDETGHHGTITVPSPIGHDPAAGSSTCDKNAKTHRSSIYVDQRLPENPTGITYVSVSSDYINCANVPTAPVVKCESDTQQGASQ